MLQTNLKALQCLCLPELGESMPVYAMPNLRFRFAELELFFHFLVLLYDNLYIFFGLLCRLLITLDSDDH